MTHNPAITYTLLVLRNIECGHPIAAGSHRDQLVDLQAALVASGSRAHRIQTLSSDRAARHALTQLAMGDRCPTCAPPPGFDLSGDRA